MIIWRHELKQNAGSLLLWTVSISGLTAVCLFLFPELKEQAEEMNAMFSSMGAFSAAFGLDELNLGTLPGFFAVECGNIISIGGVLFSAWLSSGLLSREERERTCEFLLMHPVSRTCVYFEKFFAVLTQILLLNAVSFLVCVLCIRFMGESMPWKEIGLLCLAYVLMECVTAMICFGLSAFIPFRSTGTGLGLACLFYVLSLMSSISDSLSFLAWLTPFGFCSGVDIISTGTLDIGRISLWLTLGLFILFTGWLYWKNKDIS